MDANDLIDKFVFKYDDDSTENIEWEDMVYLTTDDGMNLVKPTSRIETLKYPLSNIKASYHKRNVLLENIGAIGILSAQQNDMGGAIPMTPEEKNDIRRDWYNRQKDELIITEANVSWQPMSYPTKELMLFEELTEDKLALIDAFGLNYNLFSSTSGSTFSNVKDSIRMVYTDTIIPETQSMYDSIIKQIGLDTEGYKLVAEFDHLPVLQHDEESGANVLKTKTDAVEKMFNLGFITSEEARAILDL
jgi:phage portal protein BeeE